MGVVAKSIRITTVPSSPELDIPAIVKREICRVSPDITSNTSSFRINSEQSDGRGNTYIKLSQMYMGVPVEKSGLVVRVEEASHQVKSITGQVEPIPLSLSVQPRISADDAFTTFGQQFANFRLLSQPDLVIFHSRTGEVLLCHRAKAAFADQFGFLYLSAETGQKVTLQPLVFTKM